MITLAEVQDALKNGCEIVLDYRTSPYANPHGIGSTIIELPGWLVLGRMLRGAGRPGAKALRGRVAAAAHERATQSGSLKNSLTTALNSAARFLGRPCVLFGATTIAHWESRATS